MANGERSGILAPLCKLLGSEDLAGCTRAQRVVVLSLIVIVVCGVGLWMGVPVAVLIAVMVLWVVAFL
jgi:hypothetical protein